LRDLGTAHALLNQFPAAESSLLEASTILVKTRGESHSDTRSCYQRIIDLYSSWDKADPGKGHAAKSAEWKTKLDGLLQAPPEKKA